MWKKRTSSESSNEEHTTDISDSAFQEDDNAKRVKLASMSDTTLQDLPMELIECILVKAVSMEVKDMKLAKSVWKEKADLVISRLRTVCSQWSCILTTNFFRNELHRTLDGTAQETIRLDISHQLPLQLYVSSITTMKDEIFLLCSPHCQGRFINVYDRNNMAVVRNVIPLSEFRPKSIVACSVSNCLYILNRKLYNHISVLRVTRDDEHRSTVSTLINEMCLPHSTLCVTADGSLILSRQQTNQNAAISVCDANGSLQRKMKLSSDISWFSNVIPTSNGNLVLVSGSSQAALTEIDLDGIMIRQYKSSLNAWISYAVKYGRLLIADQTNRIELLDSEFNLMDVITGPQLGGSQVISPFEFHYNSERNEMVAIVFDRNFPKGLLTIFHLKEI